MRPNKEELHRLVDDLPPGSMSAAHRILKNLVAGPRSCKRPEDEDAAREGLEELASGKTISHEELRRRLLG